MLKAFGGPLRLVLLQLDGGVPHVHSRFEPIRDQVFEATVSGSDELCPIPRLVMAVSLWSCFLLSYSSVVKLKWWIEGRLPAL